MSTSPLTILTSPSTCGEKRHIALHHRQIAVKPGLPHLHRPAPPTSTVDDAAGVDGHIPVQNGHIFVDYLPIVHQQVFIEDTLIRLETDRDMSLVASLRL